MRKEFTIFASQKLNKIMKTIEIEGTLLDTEDGITPVTAEISDVIEELRFFGYTVTEEDSLDLVDSLLFADTQEKFLELNCNDRERLHSLVMSYI